MLAPERAQCNSIPFKRPSEGCTRAAAGRAGSRQNKFPGLLYHGGSTPPPLPGRKEVQSRRPPAVASWAPPETGKTAASAAPARTEGLRIYILRRCSGDARGLPSLRSNDMENTGNTSSQVCLLQSQTSFQAQGGRW